MHYWLIGHSQRISTVNLVDGSGKEKGKEKGGIKKKGKVRAFKRNGTHSMGLLKVTKGGDEEMGRFDSLVMWLGVCVRMGPWA